jgi:hypothetical protein
MYVHNVVEYSSFATPIIQRNNAHKYFAKRRSRFSNKIVTVPRCKSIFLLIRHLHWCRISVHYSHAEFSIRSALNELRILDASNASTYVHMYLWVYSTVLITNCPIIGSRFCQQQHPLVVLLIDQARCSHSQVHVASNPALLLQYMHPLHHPSILYIFTKYQTSTKFGHDKKLTTVIPDDATKVFPLVHSSTSELFRWIMNYSGMNYSGSFISGHINLMRRHSRMQWLMQTIT